MRYCILLASLFLSNVFLGQDYYSIDSKSFFEKGYADDTAHLESLNLKLLQAAIFHATNLERSKAKPNARMASAGENFKIPSENPPLP